MTENTKEKQIKEEEAELKKAEDAQQKIILASLTIAVSMKGMNKQKLMDMDVYTEADIDKAIAKKEAEKNGKAPEPAKTNSGSSVVGGKAPFTATKKEVDLKGATIDKIDKKEEPEDPELDDEKDDDKETEYLQPLSLDDEPGQENKEEKRTSKEAREKLKSVREAYSKEIKKCLEKMRKEIKVNRLSTKTYNILAGAKNFFSKNKLEKRQQKNPEDYKEEDFYTPGFTNKLRGEYIKAQQELKEKLMEEKTAQLTEAGFSGEELEEALARYKSTDVMYEVVVDERQKIIEEKTSLVNKNILKRVWAGYKAMPRWKKVALSTTLFLPLSAVSGLGGIVAAKYGIAALASLKFGASMATGAVTTAASGKIFDTVFSKKNKVFQEKFEVAKAEIIDEYVTGKMTEEEYNTHRNNLDKENRGRQRDQMIFKAATSILLGMGAGTAMYGAIGNSLDSNHSDHATNINNNPPSGKDSSWFFKQPGVPKDSVIDNNAGTVTDEWVKNHLDSAGKANHMADSIAKQQADSIINANKPPIDTAHNVNQNLDTAANKPPLNNNDTLNTSKPAGNVTNPPPDPTKVITPPKTPDVNTGAHSPVSQEVGKGNGAIETIREFKAKLAAEYPDPTKAPVGIQHILATDENRLAVEYGMFKPGQDAESAIMKLGSKFETDADGNVSFTQEGKTTLLEKGDDADVTNVYGGRMIDGDHSGRPSVASEPRTNGNSNFLRDQTEKDPTGAMNEQTLPKTNPSGTPDLLKNSVDKDPTGAMNENIVPGVKPVTEPVPATKIPKEVFDNGTGTNSSVISPREGFYDVGQGQNSGPNFPTSIRETEGNGFTTPVKMGNESNTDFYDRTGKTTTENIPTKSPITTVETEPKNVNVMEDPRHLDNAKDIRDEFGRRNVVIEEPTQNNINGIENSDWNKAADLMFEEKKVEFNSFEDYEKNDELQRLVGRAEQTIEYVPEDDLNAEVVNMEYFREAPEWPTISKIPAKYFFDFSDAKFVDGSPIPKADLDDLVESGLFREQVSVAPGGGLNSTYSFANHEELERLSKTYRQIIPEKDLYLGNDRPIGNETLESYVARMTKRVYQADNGTMFAPKNTVVLNKSGEVVDTGYEEMRAERRVPRVRNMYGNNTGVINPTGGAYGYQYSTQDINIARSFTNNIMNNGATRRWTH